MNATMPYSGKVDIPFSALLADPLLVLRNLPRVESIEKIGELSYLVTTTPYYIHSALTMQAKGHVILEVMDDKIVWHRCEEAHEDCNGHIEGEATATNDGMTMIDGKVELIHPMINILTWAVVKRMFIGIGDKFMREFVLNFNNPVFENVVPD